MLGEIEEEPLKSVKIDELMASWREGMATSTEGEGVFMSSATCQRHSQP